MKTIAYANGSTGEVIHTLCWGPYVDNRRKYDAQGKPMPFGMIGTIYGPGAKELCNKLCAHCGKAFNSKP